MKAVKELEAENIKVQFHQLDIDNSESIDRLANHLKEKHGGLDVLVNNAAIAIIVIKT
jgi:carbonyl reductase 1